MPKKVTLNILNVTCHRKKRTESINIMTTVWGLAKLCARSSLAWRNTLRDEVTQANPRNTLCHFLIVLFE